MYILPNNIILHFTKLTFQIQSGGSEEEDRLSDDDLLRMKFRSEHEGVEVKTRSYLLKEYQVYF
jgi:hypothetical protein